MEETAVTMTGLNPKIIMRAINDIEDNHADSIAFRSVRDYSMPNVSKKVVRIILSYTEYVNRVVWGK